jgi:hypothetical protein
MNVYMSGTLVTTQAIFVNKAGVVADPDTITLKYKKDAGLVTVVTYPTAPVVKISTGIYAADLDTSGWNGPDNQLWTTEWIGTGAVQVPGVDRFEVEALAI